MWEFRARLLAIMLERLGERGLVKARGKQRTASTHVLAAIRTLNRLEFVGSRGLPNPWDWQKQ